MFFPRFSYLKADVVCYSYGENVEDIYVLEKYFFGIHVYDEEVISNIDQENHIFDEYPSEDKEEQNLSMASLDPCSMVPVYDNYQPNHCKGHEGEKEGINMHLISSPTIINEQ
jgi:TFIIF-interacting CTD phosphatase-like protein